MEIRWEKGTERSENCAFFQKWAIHWYKSGPDSCKLLKRPALRKIFVTMFVKFAVDESEKTSYDDIRIMTSYTVQFDLV